MPTTYTIPYILVQISYQNGGVKYFAETMGYSSGFRNNSDDAIKGLYYFVTCRASRQSFEAIERIHFDDPDWMDKTIHLWGRHFSRETVLELLPRKTFTITR